MARSRRTRYSDDPEWENGRRMRLVHPYALKERLAEAQNWRCAHCGGRLDEPLYDHNMRASFEHVVPFSKGGADDESNLVIVHHICNQRRGNDG